MHIPQGASQTIDILSFEEALSLSGHGEDYDSGKWLYVPDFYTEYRYILGTRGKNPLICIGINPSTARPDDLDNTLKSVSRIRKGRPMATLATSPQNTEEMGSESGMSWRRNTPA